MSGYIPFLVTIDTDPTRFHGEHAHVPELPGRAACEQILAHLLTDLESLFPGIGSFSFVMPGAMYDQTQILRPGLPVFQALREAQAENPTGDINTDRQVVPLDRTQDEVEHLLPDASIVPGLMQNLPLLLLGEESQAEVIAEAMEHRFLEEGQLSAHSARALESHFAVAVNHVRFMTLTDLRAMLKLQLEHFGFPGLWELLDAAIEQAVDPVSVIASGGQLFDFRDGSVHCRFETFDHWARHGGGSALDKEMDLAEAYAEWTREFRQYVTTLDAYHVPLVHTPADTQHMMIEGDYLVEVSDHVPVGGESEVTEHSWGDVGVISVSVVDGARQFNYYPLSASGLNALHQAIRTRGLGPGGFSFAGKVIHDRDTRRLLPDSSAKHTG